MPLETDKVQKLHQHSLYFAYIHLKKSKLHNIHVPESFPSAQITIVKPV